MADASRGDPGAALVNRLRAAQLPPPDERRSIREQAGASLREVASALGVSATAVMRWERGERQIRRVHAIAYRQLLDALRDAA